MPAEVADLWVTLRAETAPFRRGMKQAAQDGEAFTSKMGGVRQTMVKLGKATTLVGAAFVIYGVKAAGDFQQKMNLLVTACGESKDKLKQVSDGILSLARQTGTSTNELSDGMYQVEKAGYRGADGLTVLKAATQGAREEGANLKDVTNAMTSVMASYHLKASDSVRVMNALKTAAGEGKMTMEEFSSSLSTVLPIASANKISLAQVGGAVASLTQHGTSAKEATQELANTIRNLAKPNNVAVQEMQRFGLSSTDVSTKLGQRGLTGTLNLLSQTVLSKMGPSGTVLLSAFNKSKQASADLKTMLDSMPTSLKGLASSLQSGTTSFGAYRTAIKALPADQQAMGQQFLALLQKSDGFNAALKAGGPAAETYTAAIAKMTGGSTGLNTTLQLTGENTSKVADRVAKVGKSYNDAGKDVEGWKTTQASFNVQMSRLKEAVTTTAITIGLKLIPAILSVITFFEKHRSACIALAIVIGTVLVSAVVAFTISLWGMVAAAWSTGIPELIIAIALLVVGIIELAQHWGSIWGAIKSATKAAVDWIIDAWHMLKAQTAAVWGAIEGALKTAWHAVASFFSTAWHTVTDPIVNAWRAVESATSTVWNRIVQFFKKWWPLLLLVFIPPVAILLALWNHFHTQITAVASATWNGILAFLKAIWNGIKAAASAVWESIRIAIINPLNSAWHGIESLWRTVAGWLSSAWNGIKGTASAIWNEVRSALTGPLTSAWHTISSTVAKIASTIKSGLNKAYSAVSGIGSKFEQIGKYIVQGIIHGVTSAGGALKSELGHLANGALSSAKSVLGIGSPSKVFANEVGRWIPAGIAEGVNASAGLTHQAITGMAGDSLTAFSTALEINSPSRKFAALGGYVVSGLVQGLTGSTARVKSATARIASSLYTDFGSAHKSLQKGVAKDNSELLKLAKNRDSVATKLKAAQKSLAAVQKQWTDEKNSVASGIMQNASIVTASPDEGRAVNATDVLANMKAQVQQATQFAANLDQLRKKGLSSTLVAQLATAGVDQAGATAQALAAGSKGQIQQMNSMQSSLQSAANSTGTAVANSMYGAGLKSAQGLVKGLQSQEAAIEKQMLKIAKSMQSAIKKALGIHSPSQVFSDLGQYIPQGLAQGITQGTHHATTAVGTMATAVVGAGSAHMATSGARAGASGNNINITVQGHVLTEKQLVDVVEEGMLRKGMRRSTTYQNYKRG